MFDLKITGGTVVDGTGAERYRADIGIKDGASSRSPASCRRSTRALDGDAAETIDATGRIGHPRVRRRPHPLRRSGQLGRARSSRPACTASPRSSAATAASASRPVRPGREQWLIELMEGVEDIPGTALAEGITWDWESFPEYLDAIEKRTLAVDFGTQVAHGAVRGYAMGERGARNEPAQPPTTSRRWRASSRRRSRRARSVSRRRAPRATAPSTARPVPGTYAAEEELFGLGRAMAAGGQAVFELAPDGSRRRGQRGGACGELDWMTRLAAEIERPVSFTMIQTQSAPDLWRKQLDLAGDARGRRHPGLRAVRGSPVRHDVRLPRATTPSTTDRRSAS